MKNFSDLITIFFFAVLLVLCIFVIVHATLQIKNSQYSFSTANTYANPKKAKNKMLKIIIIALVISIGLFLKIVNNVSSYNANDNIINSYKDTIAELDLALSLEFSTYKNGSYSSAEKVAKFINNQLPIMDAYYLHTQNHSYNEFSRYEIYQHKLDDFVNKPTLATYDGILMSIIKFKEGCNYINKTFIGKSDCLIEVNHFEKPNQIGADRTLFAIDGKNNRIIADANFFGK